jgi:hypothetical protein
MGMVNHRSWLLTFAMAGMSLLFAIAAARGLVEQGFIITSRESGLPEKTGMWDSPVAFWCRFAVFAGASLFLAWWTLGNIRYLRADKRAALIGFAALFGLSASSCAQDATNARPVRVQDGHQRVVTDAGAGPAIAIAASLPLLHRRAP